MKRPKDRLNRVIVIGATPSGIAATNKLGELGIPVTLIDSEPDLDKKLNRSEWCLESGVPLNYAHRPGLIRILRNPQINCVMPVDIKSIKHNPQGFRVRMKQIPSFINSKQCIQCGRCVEVCPVETLDAKKPIVMNSRQSLPGKPFIDKRREPLCQENCPLGVNAQGYVALAKAGRYKEALRLIRKDNVLPAVCGRICTHPCEVSCRRGELDAPVAIRDIKRFITDKVDSDFLPDTDTHIPPLRAEKIAIIGSGPAGLAAAADLARYGYTVTVFEKEKMAGGLLRYGIGPHRLPRDILDKEISHIEKLGVLFKTSSPIDLKKDLETLNRDFAAVILTSGLWFDQKLGVPGEDLKGVEGCISFLKKYYKGNNASLEGKTAVIGDGNAAFDLARVLTRIGADVTLLSWFSKDLIPADSEEIESAKKEGIKIRDSIQTIEFIGNNGKLSHIRCVPTLPGKPDSNGIPWPVKIDGAKLLEFEFKRAFVAIGQKGMVDEDQQTFTFSLTKKGTILTDGSMRTSIPGIYAAGDAVTGPSTVVDAMASGRRSAKAVHLQLNHAKEFPVEIKIKTERPADIDFPKIPQNIPSLARSIMPELQSARREGNFMEVAMGLSESQVASETARCLQCGVCSECLECVDACGEVGAINHSEPFEEIIEHTGVIIIADPHMVPPVKGEDVIRAYGPRAAKQDVYAMLVRGSAAAASAMVLLGGSSQRPKGHGISFTTPDQGLSSDIRVGVFACKCNDSLGWLPQMDAHIDNLKTKEHIAHAEVINAACTPEGSLDILRAIREKGVTRVLLASCVCCPLNFVCSACTDQKSRLKEALFTATGISRSMVETCNLRGEVLRLVKKDADLALGKFIGLFNRSIERARRLKALPALARNYNFTTAVVGESEATVNSATTLAEAGFDVFLFGGNHTALADLNPYSNIHFFTDASVKSISGTIGEFQVSFETGDFYQTLQVGAVILGEKSRKSVQYIHQKNLPSITVRSGRQRSGATGIPYFFPGATSIPGLFLADPPNINVSKLKKGAAAAIQAAAIMPRGPRQSKGFTVVIDETICRGCGRCINMCPYQAITLTPNDIQGWYASVDEALCKGCGNCISVCPSSAADSPYRNQGFLERTIEELLA
ncbi:MAG: FAD-dependent oxidoreductase [Deltaproteobacteria bacterium]|nr:FAD-dependent oxidoreductase [Deltaproteobacteria bacterium]